LLPEVEAEGVLPNSNFVVSTTLIPKRNKAIEEKKIQPNISHEFRY
jgi:hypothetical protein